MARFSNANVLIHPDGISATTVLAQSFQYNPNQNISSPESGYTYAKLNRILDSSPDLMFNTEDIDEILTVVPLTGLCITSETNPGVVGYVLEHDACTVGGRASSGHTSFTLENGHLLIDSISGSSTSAAVASCRAYGISSDGDAYPVLDAHNVATPSQPTNQAYIAGNIKIGGTLMAQLISLNIAYQIEFNSVIYAGSTFPTLFDVIRVEPVITAVLDNIQIINSGFSHGQLFACTHGNSYLQFKAISNTTGAPVAVGTSQHIRATFAGNAILEPAYAASGQGTGTTSILIRCIDDGTNAPIIWIRDTTYSIV